MTEPTSESLMVFPCEFVIKVFGNANEDFEKIVLEVISKHCETLRENALSYRPSKDGKYLAITVTIDAESKEQLDTIYRDLSANPAVLMVI